MQQFFMQNITEKKKQEGSFKAAGFVLNISAQTKFKQKITLIQ